MYFVEAQFSIFLTTVSDLISPPPEEAHGASICVTLMHAEIRYTIMLAMSSYFGVNNHANAWQVQVHDFWAVLFVSIWTTSS